VLCSGLAIGIYLARLSHSATAFINAARQIRAKADAEREIASWRARAGNDFWQESDHSGGDHNYEAQIDNSVIAHLRIVEPTAVTVGVTMHDGKLRCVTVIESTGWFPVASVWVNEWFEHAPSRLRVGGHNRPHDAFVDLPSSLPDEQKSKAFALNTKCMTKPSGCKTADDILPGVWELESRSSPD
jgi:hypothetical protein